MIPRIEIKPGQWVDGHKVVRLLGTGDTYRWRYPTWFAGTARAPAGTVRRVKSGHWRVEVDGEPPRTVQAANVHIAISHCVPEDKG